MVAATDTDGNRSGMVVGSFASVSLSPPLVVFFPDRSSSSWPKIQAVGRFCINVLAAGQEDVCRRFATKGGDKFAGLDVDVAPSGMPRLNDVAAWIDCEIESVHDVGDHFAVFGRVLDLDVGTAASPLLFFQGGYGRFATHSVTDMDVPGDLGSALRAVELIRSDIENLAAELGARCVVSTLDGPDVVIIATAGSNAGSAPGTLVGQRLPFLAPTASVLAAWRHPDTVETWLSGMPSPGAKSVQQEHLDAVRRRGYSLALRSASAQAISALDQVAEDPAALAGEDVHGLFGRLTYDPADTEDTPDTVGLVTVPVFDGTGTALIALHVFGFSDTTTDEQAAQAVLKIRNVADRGSSLLTRTPTH
ncbi:flavin reductase [Rhodococcus rhodochrous]|uniref:Flavin reductase n=1 Tax=Rhodococcus rhodochrous TaxID=1829 RepID=A0AAW4XMJ1_RHORH|nr:flavin reductase [Rhodococcus rhodochrous]